jgi:hypothetical protein
MLIYLIPTCILKCVQPELSIREASSFVIERDIEKLIGIFKILVELIQAGGKTLCSRIHKLVHSVWNKKISAAMVGIFH